MHQRRNAEPLAARDGCVIFEDRIDPHANVTHVGPILRTLMEDAPRRAAMRQRLRDHAPPDAALDIAQRLLAPIP
jgi:UDP-N-acetylglucosamine:LPS N-acetylglucosamine transferase